MLMRYSLSVKSRRRFLLSISKAIPLVILQLFVCCTRSSIHDTPQQQILHNGTIYTMNDDSPVVEAVAVEGNTIIAVGSLEEVRRKTGNNANEIDLMGKWLIPGLIDSHVHAIKGGERLLSADAGDKLLGADELAQFAQEAMESGRGMRGDGLLISGMHSGMWSRTEMLDSIFNGQPYETLPVLLAGTDGHTAWANAVLLDRAKVNRAFIRSLPPEQAAYYALNEKSDPSGFISEDAVDRIIKALPESSITAEDAVDSAIRHLNSLGITAWMDPSVTTIDSDADEEQLKAYHQAAVSGRLTAHVVGLVVANANDSASEQLRLLEALRIKYSDSLLTLPGFKIFLDGVLEYPTQTAAISVGYRNSRSNGALMVDPGRLKQFVAAADKHDCMVHVHAIGDRAVTAALDAFEEARRTNQSSLPHSITHLQLVASKDFSRFASFNVIPCMQLLWANADVYTVDLVQPYVDSALYKNHYPAGSLVTAGAIMSGASDWPVSSANPFEAIAIAETREGPLGKLFPEEAVSRSVMIKAYTINAAKALRLDHRIGSIEVGKRADFTLLDRDVFAVDADTVQRTRVIWTMFGGERVFDARGGDRK